MQTKINERSKTEKEIDIKIPWSETGKDYEKFLSKFGKDIKLQGFRKGKAPLSIIEKKHGPAIEWEFIKENFWTYFSKAMEETKIKPINQPQITDVDFKKGEHLAVTFQVQVLPEWDLPNYKKYFTVEKPYYKISKKDIEHSIEELRKKHAKVKEIKTPAQMGNHLTAQTQKLDKNGKDIDKPYETVIPIGEQIFTGKIADELVGIKINETRTITLEDPANKDNTLKFKVTPGKIEEHILPELNDEFAKKVDPKLNNIKELKNLISSELEKSWEKEVEKAVTENIADYFIEQLADLELPSDMVNDYLEKLFEDEKKRNPKVKDEDLDEFKKSMKDQSIKIIKWVLVKNRIIENEKIGITEEDVSNEVDKILSNIKDEKQKEMYKQYHNSKEFKENLKSQLMEEKLTDHLKQFAKYKKKKVDKNNPLGR